MTAEEGRVARMVGSQPPAHHAIGGSATNVRPQGNGRGLGRPPATGARPLRELARGCRCGHAQTVPHPEYGDPEPGPLTARICAHGWRGLTFNTVAAQLLWNTIRAVVLPRGHAPHRESLGRIPRVVSLPHAPSTLHP